MIFKLLFQRVIVNKNEGPISSKRRFFTDGIAKVTHISLACNMTYFELKIYFLVLQRLSEFLGAVRMLVVISFVENGIENSY